MDGTIRDAEHSGQSLQALRAENLALRCRVEELEQLARFHARSANRLVHQILLQAEQDCDRPPVEPAAVTIVVQGPHPAIPRPRLWIPAPVRRMVALPARRIVRFARRHRSIFAPHGSYRERVARKLMVAQRRARGIAA